MCNLRELILNLKMDHSKRSNEHLTNGAPEPKRSRNESGNNLNENNVLQTNRNGVNSLKCMVCLWPIHSPQCYHSSNNANHQPLTI